MPRIDVTVQYRDPEGKTRYLTINPVVDPGEDIEAAIQLAADLLAGDGLCTKLQDRHYVFIPPHAIHRVDFQETAK